MKGHYTLLLGALVIGAVVLPRATHAQAVCMVDQFGYAWDLVLDTSSNMLTGSVNTGDNVNDATAARGANSRTRRHHVFTAVNRNTGGSSDCSDGAGHSDWFTYNGNVGSPSGGAYPYNGNWVSSCGFTGTVTGTITFGACRIGQTQPDPNGPASAHPQQADAAARVTPQGYGFTSAPNPFEAGAVISYTIPQRTDVRVTVYDTLGRQVAVLVDAVQEAGTHTVTFDGASLAAGTYVCQIVAGTYTEARQLTLAR